MKIYPTGINYETGQPFFAPIDERQMADRLYDALARNADSLRRLAQATSIAGSFRGEVGRPVEDMGNPRAVGWTYLVNDADPRRHEYAQALAALSEHRGMADPARPLLFHGEDPDEWGDWINEEYSGLELEKVPHYVLIVGGPDQVPFRFQSLLGCMASVGRVAFESMDELRAYADKIVRLERALEPVVARKALVFAPDHGPGDPTYYSHNYMARPMADRIAGTLGAGSTTLLAEAAATKAAISTALRGAKPPALVYTASHGLIVPGTNLAEQQAKNGAICCQVDFAAPPGERYFTGADVPPGEPFLEGSVFFQFACFGYGTPRESDFAHWLPDDAELQSVNAAEDFVSALPRRLLAHPHGPIAYIGHVDAAFLHGFADPEAPEPALGEVWQPRITPYVSAVDRILAVEPVGRAMQRMWQSYSTLNASLTNTYDRIQRGKIQVNDEFLRRLAQSFVTRNDAQGFMVFGDPAARLRLPDE